MRFDLPEGLKLVHEMRIPVRWGDLDAMGHSGKVCGPSDRPCFS
jgi:hypothetical protein